MQLFAPKEGLHRHADIDHPKRIRAYQGVLISRMRAQIWEREPRTVITSLE